MTSMTPLLKAGHVEAYLPLLITIRWLYAAAIVFGVALGVHHVTVGLLLPALAAMVWKTRELDSLSAEDCSTPRSFL